MNKSGRAVGMTVFILGIILLLFVLSIAYGMFTSAASDLLPSTGGSASALTVAGLGASMALVIVKIALLFVMTLAGSLIASRGIQLFFASGENTVRGKLMPKEVER